jgi:phosphate-selective porin OprO and OprP
MKNPCSVLSAAAFAACVFGALGAPASAQGEGASVEGKLLEILKGRGVISDAEYAELRTLELDLRRRESVEAQIESRVDEMTARLVADGPTLSHKPGGGFNFKTADGDFSLNIGGRVQTRFSYEFESDSDGDGATQDDLPSFDTPRVRLQVGGNAFGKDLTYGLMADFGGDSPKGAVTPSSVGASFSGADRLAELKDGFLDYAVSGAAFHVKAGQFKTPYSRQQLTSSGRQMFVDRAITDRVFAPGRSKGLLLYGSVGGEKDDFFEWSAGAFNGEGENLINNDDGLMWVGRVAANPFGGVAYSEADLRSYEDREKFLLAVGLNGWYHQEDSRASAGGNFDSYSVGFDVAAHWYGFFATVEYHHRENQGAAASPPPDVKIDGWAAQLGYNFTPEWNVAFRMAEIDWDNPTSFTAAREWTIGVGYFIKKHALKVQADFGRVQNRFLSASSIDDDHFLRLQAQLDF